MTGKKKKQERKAVSHKKFPGVYARTLETRLPNGDFDRVYWISFKDFSTGKLIWEKCGTASGGWNPQKAQRRRYDILEQDRAGEYKSRKQTRQEAITFDRLFIEYYFPNAKANKKANSCRTEEVIYKTWISPNIGNLSLKSIAPIHLEKLKKKMADAGRTPRTVSYCMAVIRQVYNFARKHDLYEGGNPTDKVKMPRNDNRRLRFLSREEADRLLKALQPKSLEVYEIALLSLHCGLRAGEIFNLTWGDLDIERGIMMLRDTKSKRNRAAYMTTDVKEMFLSKEPGAAEVLIWPDRKGGKIRAISKTFDRTVAELGFNREVTDARQKVVFHSLRHTFASWLVEGGVDLYKVKTLLGHSTIALTERYSHLGAESLQEAVKVLEQAPDSKRAKLESVNGGKK